MANFSQLVALAILVYQMLALGPMPHGRRSSQTYAGPVLVAVCFRICTMKPICMHMPMWHYLILRLI